MNKYIFDSHVHSENSFDACDSVITLCEEAIKNNIDGFCITDHLEVHEYNEEYKKSITKSHKDTKEAALLFKDKLKLRTGIEMGQPLQNIEVAEMILEKFPCDFIIGSMHNAKNEKDFYFMEKCDFEHRLDELLTKYYEECYEMVKWGKFDVIGHITYPLRYIEGNFKMKIDMTKYNDAIYEMLKLAAHKNIGIEVNVSGFRQQYGKQFPNFEHIKAFKEFGGEIVTLGSDSHNRYSIGENFKEGKEILLKSGFEYYCEFENRRPHRIKLL